MEHRDCEQPHFEKSHEEEFFECDRTDAFVVEFGIFSTTVV
jgi:hypothetical protein